MATVMTLQTHGRVRTAHMHGALTTQPADTAVVAAAAAGLLIASGTFVGIFAVRMFQQGGAAGNYALLELYNADLTAFPNAVAELLVNGTGNESSLVLPTTVSPLRLDGLRYGLTITGVGSWRAHITYQELRT